MAAENFTLGPLFMVNARGKPITWQVEFDSASSELAMTHGQVGGKMTVMRRKVVENKSGRSLLEQARLEAEKRFKDASKKGYRPRDVGEEKKKDASGEEKKAESLFELPMLTIHADEKSLIPCEEDTDRQKKKKNIYPCWVQPKFDGMRCVSKLAGEGCQYWSRTGREWKHMAADFDPELSALIKLLPFENVMIDGEMYLPGAPFNQISEIIRNERHRHPLFDKLTYFIFDFSSKEELSFELREKALREAAAKMGAMKRLVVVKSEIAESWDAILKKHAEYTAVHPETFNEQETSFSYEGIIIRKNLPYVHRRSANLLKYKTMLDAEGTLVDVLQGEGIARDLAMFVVKITYQTPEGKEASTTITMTPEGDFDQRRKWLAEKASIIGKVVSYKYQSIFPETGAPRFPIARGIRDE